MKKRILFALMALMICLMLPLTAQAAKNGSTTITISAAGDCTLGVDSRYNDNFNIYYRKHDAAYFLKKVKKVFSKDDITICNLEGTLTTATTRADKTFTFKGPASYTEILTSGSVEVVNMANNHTRDFGTKGFEDTQKALKKAKIRYCIDSHIAYKKVNGVKVAFLGFNCLNGVKKSTVKKYIDQAHDNGAAIVIVSFHWGVERDNTPNKSEIDMGHYAIDNGADLVLGHHPHILQGIEKYHGRYIVYSLGNFCFGGNSNPSDKDTMIFQQTFYLKDGKLRKKNDAKVIPCSLSSSTNTNDFQPRILKGSDKERLIKKINKLCSGLHTSADSDGKLK